MEPLFQAAQRQFDTPTVLMNNVGIDAAGIPVKDMPSQRFDQAMKTNLYAPFMGYQQFSRPHEAGGGTSGNCSRGDLLGLQ